MIRVPTSTSIGALVATFGDEKEREDGSAVYYEFMNKVFIFSIIDSDVIVQPLIKQYLLIV